MTRPPRLATRWLERRLHPEDRDEIVGDLDEQFQRRAIADGAGAARRWYWRQAIALVWGFFVHRRAPSSSPLDHTGVGWPLRDAAGDLRYAWRSLVGSWGTTAVALLTLTLGIGLSTAVFSLVNSILVRPLPYPGADRLVRIAETRPGRGGDAPLTAQQSADRVSDVVVGQFVETAETLEAVTPYNVRGRNVTTPRGTEQAATAEVGVAFFDLLGVQPVAGRLFLETDERSDAPPAVVISDRLWKRELDARPDVIGASLAVENQPHTIVGVASSALAFPTEGIDVWIAGRWRWPAPGQRRIFSTWTEAIARLRPGASAETANVEATRIAHRIASADPAFFTGGDVPVPEIQVRLLQEDMVRPVRAALLVLAAGMALVLAAACANLVNLLLARSTARQRELAVRLTLGASRWRVVRPLLFEQLLLSGVGAALGASVARWTLLGLPLLAPPGLPRLADVGFDAQSLAFSTGAAVLIGLAVGLLPAWQLPAANLQDLCRGSRVTIGRVTASAEAVRRAMVVGQVALTVALVVAAALLGRSLIELIRVDPGFRGRGALTFQVGLPDGIWRIPGRQAAFLDALVARLRQHPSVVSVGVTSTLPLHPVGLRGSFAIEGRPRPTRPEEWPVASKIAISPGYLDAVGTRVIRGRGFTDADSPSAPLVALVDEATARQYFPGDEPLGRRIEFARRLFTIVGLVESIKQRGVAAPAETTIYFAAPQLSPVMAFNRLTGGAGVRTTGDPLDVVPFIRSAVREIDPASPVFNVMRLDDRLSATFAEPRFYSLALGVFAALVLATSILGVYGVLSYAVERRRVEFGVRRALGATERHVAGLVLRQASSLILTGLVLGLGIAAAGARLLGTLLFGVEPLDAATFAAAAVFIMATGLAAAWLPARHALAIDPARALRAD